MRYLLAATLLCLVGCGPRSGTNPASNTPTAAPYVLGIEAAQATRQQIAPSLSLNGAVVSDRKVDLAAEVSGRVLEVRAQLGQRVRAGELLVRISPVENQRQTELDQAQAQQQASQSGVLSLTGRLLQPGEVPFVRKSKNTLTYAEQKYGNYKRMRAEELVSDQQVTDAYHDYLNAKNDYEANMEQYRLAVSHVRKGNVQVKIDRQKLADYQLHAPFDGYIQECKATVGAFANQGQPLGLQLVSDSPLFVELDVPQQYAAELRPGLPVKVTSDAAGEKSFDAYVERLSPSANQSTRTLSLQARLNQPPQWLKPGLYVRASIQLQQPQTRLLIPDAAVLTQQGKSVVFRLQPQEGEWLAQPTPVKLGRSHHDWVEVTGLTPQQWVASSDLGSLQKGTRVKIAREVRYQR